METGRRRCLDTGGDEEEAGLAGNTNGGLGRRESAGNEKS